MHSAASRTKSSVKRCWQSYVARQIASVAESVRDQSRACTEPLPKSADVIRLRPWTASGLGWRDGCGQAVRGHGSNLIQLVFLLHVVILLRRTMEALDGRLYSSFHGQASVPRRLSRMCGSRTLSDLIHTLQARLTRHLGPSEPQSIRYLRDVRKKPQ